MQICYHKEFCMLGFFIAGLCLIWAEIIWEMMNGKKN